MFSNYNYDIVIIGGGVSGLFLAYKLLPTDLKVILFEGNKQLGGRIKTVEKNGSYFEAGAARIHSSHGKFISLIHDLDLRDDLLRLPEKIDIHLRGKNKDYTYGTKWKKMDPFFLLKTSLDSQDSFEDKELQRITFFQYLVLVFDHEAALYIKDSFGYDSEFVELNAYAAIEMFKGDLFGDNHYYILKNGMSQLITKMEKELLINGTIIKKGVTIKNIDNTFITTEKNEKFFFNNLICAIPKISLQKFPIFKDVQLINSVNEQPLLRIYAKYPSNNVWFKNINRTTTDNYIRQIIPIDPNTGLIMISYMDGKLTEYWNSYHSLGEKYLIKALHKEIKDIYNITPPDPEFISVHFWKGGFHTWNIGEDSTRVEKEILKPFKNKEIYICGEAYSLKQGWIEGALETCYNILQILPPLKYYKKVKYEFECDTVSPSFEIKPKKKIAQEKEVPVVKKKEVPVIKKKEVPVIKKKEVPVVKKKEVPVVKKKEVPVIKKKEVPVVKEKEVPVVKKKEVPVVKKKEVLKPEDTVLKLDDVLEEDEWIILEVNGKKNVYDISQWISKHPGGSSILKGVEANKYYENSKLYPDSPTDIFNGNHVHAEANAWEKYVVKNNDSVKLIGYIV
jgi:monoamine oxidase